MIWDWMNGWLWVIAAVLVGLVELILPGWLFLGTAIALLVMGIALLTGLWGWGLPGALIVTGILSFLAWFALRRLVGVHEGQVRIWDRDINDP